ncbi:unnamed protein product [Urochloa decumbens]|uniref:F-box domain-containing protein n=1 Tax=Urochloa decumbens TaxID=240449 RepID=A0ABC8ZDB4_9POAL
MARRSRKKQRVPSLPDDLIVEILSRVPYRSLCRFKCVSRSWLALCSDPDLRKKSPQTLSGFFCYSRHEDNDYDIYCPHLINLSGRGRPVVDPSPPFLEGYASPPLFLQCSSSLLLWKFCKSSPLEAEYVVSNPATQKWILLPPTEARHPVHLVRLGFDPAVPSCFYVFMFMTGDYLEVTGVEIYSSETGGWIFRQSEWEEDTTMGLDSETVFFNGTLYSTTPDLSLLSIDVEGKTWRKIRMPHSDIRPKISEDDCFIVHSQGRLYAMHIDFRNHNQLSVWALGANGNEQWALEHTASITQLLGRHHRGEKEFYILIAAHPERNLIYLTGGLHAELMSYDMDKKEVHAICTLQEYFLAPCLPYIPCFVEWSLPLRMVTES